MANSGVRFEFETSPAKLLSFAMDLTFVTPVTIGFFKYLRMAYRLHFLSRSCCLLVKRVASWILNEHSNGFTKFPDAAIDGSDLCQHHSHTFHGWGPGRQFWASWNSHGIGAGGLLSLARVPSF